MTRLLVIEDSPTQAQSLQFFLESEGFEVEVASDGRAGLKRIVETSFDLVLSDILMPEMNGYEVCRAIKASPEKRDIPVILLTTLNDPTDIIEGLECGADNFITKSYARDQLLGRIRHILSNRQLRAEGRNAGGVDILFMGKKFTITSEREQILDLLITTFEDTVRTNRALQVSQTELAAAKATVEAYARRLEGRVRSSEEKYRAIVEHASDAIFILDTAGRMLELNHQAQKLIGRTLEESVGRAVTEFVVESRREEASLAFANILKVGNLQLDEVPLRTFRELPTYADISAALVQLGGEQVVIAIARDATERKHLEEERVRLFRQAQESITARDEFLTLAAHELKTPLTPLLIQIQSLQRQIAREGPAHVPSEKVLAQLTKMSQQVERVALFANKLLDASQLGTHGMGLEPEELDLVAVVRSVLTGYEDELARSGCPVVLRAETPVVGWWDRLRLEQIVTNLLLNAAKFGAGAPIEITVETRDGNAHLSIKDKGIGIAAEDQQRIFDRFERAVPSQNYGGFGLGLWIVSELAAAHHGTVTVQSRPNQGALFEVVLPCRPPREAEEQKAV